MITVKPYFGDPHDEWWGWTEYDYCDQDIGINLTKAWVISKTIDYFIELYIDTIIHETLHIAILTETKFWALGEELTVRRLNNETMQKSKFNLYLKEYNISKVEGSKIKEIFYGDQPHEHTRKHPKQTRLRDPLGEGKYGPKGQLP